MERWGSKWNNRAPNGTMECWGSKLNDRTVVFQMEQWGSKWIDGTIVFSNNIEEWPKDSDGKMEKMKFKHSF